MVKKEYLVKRFQKEFLQYCLIQENSLSAKELADNLYGIIAFDSLITEGKSKIESLITDHLSFDKVKVDGRLSNELSDELNYDLKDRMVSEFKAWISERSSEEIAEAAVLKVERRVELQTWSNGILNMQEAIRLLVERLNSSSRSYDNLISPAVSENEMLEKFNNAKENTLLERIQGNNLDDIIEYRSAMMQYVRTSCENILYARQRDIYALVADNRLFVRLQSNFSELAEYSQALNSSTADLGTHEEWDREYNRLVPTDFYHRNVENITAENAFHIVVLQFFAMNEEWMTDNGLLKDGELSIFTNSDPSAVAMVLNNIISNS